ncbi:MAG: UDP-N-acetylmuramate--L-alanine ligase [Oscillospiraceae bacterium]|nr:UDP-N-acetylmuramate--L-alanine ligase [Oscillospiraceae bacterium]
MSLDVFGKYLASSDRPHLVGIGGVSMSPLAAILHDMKKTVTGSDISENPAIKELRERGIKIEIGHSAENISGAGYIIRTAAAREDNIEIMAAREQNIPVFERAEAWGYIMRRYREAICISGVHGKTTTTSMTSHILLHAGVDPTIMIGGTLPVIKSGCHIGKGDIIVLESCEYYNSFHNFRPTTAVILNIDADHLDFFGDLDGLKCSFRKFASLVPESGRVICNGDDENTMSALNGLNRGLITFGFGENARITDIPVNIRGTNLELAGQNPSMTVTRDGKDICKIRLQIPGMHNLTNALAAAAVCLNIGISPKIIEEGLLSYSGVARRFDYKGSYNGAGVYDDYAHHPRELGALLDAISTIDTYKRIILAFQPHTYSRTKALFSEFAAVLKRADIVFLAEIYAARETNTVGITSTDLAAAVPGARCISDFSKLTDEIAAIAREGDIILTVGAGDIYKVGVELVGRAD